MSLATGQLVRQAASESVESEEFQEFCHAGFNLRLRGLPDFEAEGDVVEHAHRLEERIALENESDVALLDRHIIDAHTTD